MTGSRRAPSVIVLALRRAADPRRAWRGTPAGLSRSKNAAGTVLRNALDLAVAALAFWAVGAAIMNGDAGLIFDAKGRAGAACSSCSSCSSLIATAPVVGAVAERCRFFPMLAAPRAARAAVDRAARRAVGVERRMASAAWASSTPPAHRCIHVTGGSVRGGRRRSSSARRSGKYNRDGSSNFIPGHSVPMASVGVLLMLAGWAPYVLAAPRWSRRARRPRRR